jgi:outer membrane lipoprotein-sorting protein
MRHLILLACAVAAPFQAAAQDTTLPSVDRLLEKYVAASGGAAVQKITSRITTGSIEVLTYGLTGTFEQYTKAPGRQVNISDLSGFGKVIHCSDGKNGWASDPQQGLRPMSAAELAVLQRGADLQSPLHVANHYKKMAVTGKGKVGDRDAYVVEAQPPVGGPEKLYFDIRTGLLIRVERPDQTGGSVITFDDFKEVDGVKIPLTIHQDGGQADVLIKIRDVRHNVPIDDARFAKPAA